MSIIQLLVNRLPPARTTFPTVIANHAGLMHVRQVMYYRPSRKLTTIRTTQNLLTPTAKNKIACQNPLKAKAPKCIQN